MNYAETRDLIASLGAGKIIELLGLETTSRIIVLDKIGRKRYFQGAESDEYIGYGKLLKLKSTVLKYKITANAETE